MKFSLHKKIFIAFFFVALVPFFLLLYYTYEQNRELALDKLEFVHKKSLDQITVLIQEDIKELEREIGFLASLHLMDDLISDDVDKRILELIALKQSVFKLHTQISVRSSENICIASTSQCKDQDEGIHFKQKIFLSFDSSKEIGEIEIFLPYGSLRYYFKDFYQDWCLKNRQKELLNSCNTTEQLVLSKALNDELTLSFLINKKELDRPLKLLQKQLLIVAGFSLLSFLALFFFVSRAIAKPIAQNAKLQSQKLQLQESELLLLEEAKHSAQIKTRFISQISHDFRTPLNSIIGFSQFLDQENLVESEYKKLPKNIENAGKHLLEMVNQVLEFAKAESEHLSLELEELELCSLIHETVEIIKPLSEKKFLELSCECKELHLICDKNILKNILINLLANAVKFTDEGYIKILVEIQEAYVKISVRDSGIGIKEKDEQSLFKIFNRLDNAKKVEGSGLGLALCAAYAQKLHAKLQYKPHSQGSEFSITLRIKGKHT